MSEFIELNLPEYSTLHTGYSVNEDMARINDKFCIFCHRRNVQFINLSTCVHANILDNLLEMKMLHINHTVCSWCHSTLEKINDFKMLALKSFNFLSSGFKCYPHNLTFSKIEQYSTINSQPIEVQTVDHTIKSEPVEADIEIKKEHNNISDFDNDIPLVQVTDIYRYATSVAPSGPLARAESNTKTDESLPQITKRKRCSKKTESSLTQSKKKPKKPKSKEKKVVRKKVDRCEDKVKIIVLSEQEMLEDRKLNASKSRYLRLPYKCEKCITSFDHEVNLVDHLKKKHKKKEGSQVCNICESVLNTKISFEEHYKRHYRRYECIKCGRRDNNVYSVLQHYKETHGKVDMTFTCQLCDFTTESHRRIRYHRSKHRLTDLKCDLCGNTFVTSAGLRGHMLSIHKLSNRTYSCEPCGKVYRNKSGLSTHMALKHSDMKPAYCVPCNQSFRSESSLRHHLRKASKHISEEDKKFTCSDCNAKYLTKRQLQEHIDWVHLKCTNHTCNKCSKSFKCERNLKRHLMYVHDKIRPPRNKICDHCGRAFTTSAILRCHIRTHTGERPLQCTHCAATFAHSAALYTHKKLVHNKQKK